MDGVSGTRVGGVVTRPRICVVHALRYVILMNAPPDHRVHAGIEALAAPVESLDALRCHRRQLATMIGQREEFYRSVLDSLAEGVVITDTESRIVYANHAMEALSGYSQDELLGRISYELLSPKKNWPKMRRRLSERLSGKTENYEHELVRKDGKESWIRVQATPYRNASGDIVGTVGAINCIDRQKTLERENEYLVDEIRREQDAGLGAPKCARAGGDRGPRRTPAHQPPTCVPAFAGDNRGPGIAIPGLRC